MTMNRRYSLGFFAALAVLLVCGGQSSALAGESSDKGGEDIVDTLQNRHAIGKPLAVFKPFRKRYQQAIKWWSKPGAKPSENKSLSDTRWILGGLFQAHEVKGKWLGIDYEGLATFGHDNGTGEYVLSWIDSFHSGIFHARGKYDVSSKSFTFLGSYFDVVAEQDRSIKIVMTFTGKKGKVSVEIFDVSLSGEPVKFIEVESKRFVPIGA